MTETIVPDEVSEKRADKARNSNLWTPRDALASLVRDIDAGKVNPSRLVVHYVQEAGTHRTHHYRAAKVTFEEHIALLNVALHDVMTSWVSRD